MRHIGFTGTRKGMTGAQIGIVSVVMTRIDDEWGNPQDLCFAHHGDCKGADEQFHSLANQHGWVTIGHIPDIGTLRALCTFTSVRDPLPYPERNKAIVDESDVMIAGPHDMADYKGTRRGGTWSTIRYARKIGKPLAIVWPDGRVTYERWP